MTSNSVPHRRRCVRRWLPLVSLVALSCIARANAQQAGALRDCAVCPEMVVIPPGTFTMGSSASEKRWAAGHGGNLKSVSDEAPQHRVSLPSFALGKYDVTRAEYAAFVRETGYPLGDGCGHDGAKWQKRAGVGWRNPGFRQSERDPVICVSWRDARAYMSWLNRKVHLAPSLGGEGPYRLPTESEWEYAARAGTTTRFWWGDDDDGADRHAWYKRNSADHTHPVGSKPANPFGLYDMAGNVWQWTEDCYVDSYANAPTDGGAAESGSDCLRADRGASWFYDPWLLRLGYPREKSRGLSGPRNGISRGQDSVPSRCPARRHARREVRQYVRVSTSRVILEHVEIIDGTGAGARRRIRTSTISRRKDLGDFAGADEAPSEGTTILDLRGYSVMPGIVGMHDHLFDIAPPGT